MLAGSNGRSRPTVSNSTFRQRTNTDTDRSQSPPSIREGRDLRILVPKIEVIPSPPFQIPPSERSSCGREFDGPLGSRAATARETSAPKMRLSNGHSESRRSSTGDIEKGTKSSTSSSRSTVAASNGANKLIRHKSSVLSRRHSAEITSSKSVCHGTGSRGRSVTASRHQNGSSAANNSRRSPSCQSRSGSDTNLTSKNRRSSMNDLEEDNKSYSCSSRSTVAVSNGTNKSVRHKSSVLSRRHSAEITSSKSVCHGTGSRGRSVSASRYHSERSNTSDAERSASYQSRSNSATNKSFERKSSTDITSSKSVCRTESRGRSVTSHQGTRSKKYDPERRSRQSRTTNAVSNSSSKSLGPKSSPHARRHSAEITSSYSSDNMGLKRNNSSPSSPQSKACVRGRSKNREDDKSIFSAGRSFANSLTRRRSLSRSASKVLHTTSTMDGGYDVEPCTQRYELPFNPSTGACNYHPECIMAVKNSGPRGGWKILRDECPNCQE